jgi:hypothetical protein
MKQKRSKFARLERLARQCRVDGCTACQSIGVLVHRQGDDEPEIACSMCGRAFMVIRVEYVSVPVMGAEQRTDTEGGNWYDIKRDNDRKRFDPRPQ